LNKQDNRVCIHPDKEVQKLTVSISNNEGPSYFIRVDFIKNRFYCFELNLDSKTKTMNPNKPPRIAGDIETFKKKLYQVNLWDWETDYHLNGIVLDGTCWSVKLETRTKVYVSKGLKSFPTQWPKFYQALTKLIGVNLF
jgi:hypothetical protein